MTEMASKQKLTARGDVKKSNNKTTNWIAIHLTDKRQNGLFKKQVESTTRKIQIENVSKNEKETIITRTDRD